MSPPRHAAPPLRRRRRGATTLALALATLVCVAALPGAATASATAPFGTRADVPWSSVGRGWVVSQWYPADNPRHATSSDLVLVSPAGTRYLLSKLPAAFDELAAWSGDGQDLLLDGGASTASVEVLDLRSGAVVSRFHLPASASVFFEQASFTRPDGYAIDLITQTDDHQQLARYSLDGAHQLTYPTTFSQLGAFSGAAISSPDGTELVMGAAHGLAIVGNDGAVLDQLRLGGPLPYCLPQRWWSPTVVLARCGTTPRLYEFPVDGGAPRALTQRPVPPDDGDLSAWHLGTAVYVQVASACGYEYLGRLVGAHPTMVHVPGVPEGRTVSVVGTSAHALSLEAGIACEGGPSLLWYTPSLDRTQVVLGRPATSGSAGSALIYPTPLG